MREAINTEMGEGINLTSGKKVYNVSREWKEGEGEGKEEGGEELFRHFDRRSREKEEKEEKKKDATLTHCVKKKERKNENKKKESSKQAWLERERQGGEDDGD